MELNAAQTNDLDHFIEFLYDGLQGYVYLAAKVPNTTQWMQEFLEYPKDVDKLKATIRGASKSHDIYLSPVVWTNAVVADNHEQKTIRQNIKATNVVWTEFDGNAPDWTDTHGEPSLIVQTSASANQHVYWRLNDPLTDVDVIEDITRRITYNMQADSSAWDATQVLRPPETLNHKYEDTPAVSTRYVSGIRYDVAIFDSLAPAPEQITGEWELAALPNVQSIILKYAFTPDLVALLQKEKHEVTDRSSSLMNLAYGCCQLGMNDAEVFVVLLLADDRWEKFKHRKDRNKRLAHIITVARNKYPEPEDDEDGFTLAFDYVSFLNTEITVDWLIEPMLMENGSMLMVGPSGIGKTQISLQFMIHLALGKDFLHYKIPNPKKVVFLSLEMDHGSLKQFMVQMNAALSDPERAILAENFIIVPHGEPWALNTLLGQEHLVTLIEATEPDVIFVDSIGSAIKGNISSDENVQPLLDFNDRIRKKYNLSVWYIHHMRKAQQGSNGAASQDDIYGNQYLLNRATSAYGILPAKGGNIKMRAFKSRLAAKEQDHLIRRIDHLNFEAVNKQVDGLIEHITHDDSGDDDNDDSTAPNGLSL